MEKKYCVDMHIFGKKNKVNVEKCKLVNLDKG